MAKIILTTQSTGTKGKYRLGISLSDSKRYFERGGWVLVIAGKRKFHCTISCGHPLPKGFDIYTKELSKWIIVEGYHKYSKGTPTKLVFEITIKTEYIVLKFKSKSKTL